ncbi:MAG: DUF1330 domain-containing protein [Desulfobacteraceae bacterium]|nr:MAG: DUF1330 domain-containing protein [Desulfobacteraceae bacterium]
MSFIHPTEQQIKEFLAKKESGPIVMINLLKFKKESEEDGKTGEDRYDRYMINVAPMLERVGGRLLWMGAVDGVFIGSDRDRWDRMLLVEYPSRTGFFQMISDPEYLAVHQDRELALETSVLLPAITVMSAFS